MIDINTMGYQKKRLPTYNTQYQRYTRDGSSVRVCKHERISAHDAKIR